MKKIFKTAIILFIFCLTFTLGGFFTNLNLQTKENKAPTEISKNTAEDDDVVSVQIASASDLAKYIEKYSSVNQYDSIVLTADINMAGITLNKTLGTEDLPFMGVFDGKGVGSGLKIFGYFQHRGVFPIVGPDTA